MMNGLKKTGILKKGIVLNPEIFSYQFAEYNGSFWTSMIFYGDIEVFGVILPKYSGIKRFLYNLNKIFK